MNRFIRSKARILKKELFKWYDIRFRSAQFNIIKKPETEFDIVKHIKDDTYEVSVIEETYGINKAYNTRFYHCHQDVLMVDNAVVTDGSDIVQTSNRVLWDKSCQSNFSIVIPTDSNLLKYSNEFVKIRESQNICDLSGTCISLLGVHASTWAHFIVQFLPKLYDSINFNLLNKDTTLIIPDYKDEHISSIINDILDKHNINIKVAARNQSFHCERLLYIPTSVYLANHIKFLSPCHVVLPQRVLQMLTEYLIMPLVSQIKNREKKYSKVYLVRRGLYRSLSNWEEIESYFQREGFYFAEPHKMSLLDKVSLFYHADILVGPFSSAWSNAMFCNGAKGLIMTNLQRIYETYQVSLGHLGKVNYLQVTGWDESIDPHTNYYIPLEKVKSAYMELLSR